jgi:uncharacterized protein YyaL (SSP411 family)
MLDELLTADGGFACALDADSEGVEGRFYVWPYEEFMSVLTDAGLDDAERRLLAAYWGLTAEGNWEGTNVLHLPGIATPPPELVRRGRTALLAARSQRIRPARDDKQLAAWNGLALRSLARGALVLDEPRYAAAVRRLIGFVEVQLLREGDRLWRTARDGRAHTPGFCEDYLALADGLLTAHAASGEPEPLLLARRLVEAAVRDFWDPDAGTFVDTSSEHDRTVAQPRGLVDNATPSANSIGADVLQQMALLTGDETMARRASSILRAVAPVLERQPSAFGRMLCAADRLLGEQIDVVVAGDPRSAEAGALRAAAAAAYAPDLVLTGVAEGDPHADWPLYHGKVTHDGSPTAYACRGYACDEPTGVPSLLAEQVRRLAPSADPASHAPGE